MRLFVLAAASALTFAFSAGAEENLLAPGAPDAGGAPKQPDRAVRSAVPDAPKAELDELFVKLGAAKSVEEAHPFEQRIMVRWNQSGSATVDMLLAWADTAIKAKNFPRALDLLDQLVVLKPDFAEGYNRRATVYYMLDDYTRSMADIRTTLGLEPRHFGALSGLGMILAEIGEKPRAEEIFRRALSVHPQFSQVKEQLEKLEAEDKGVPL